MKFFELSFQMIKPIQLHGSIIWHDNLIYDDNIIKWMNYLIIKSFLLIMETYNNDEKCFIGARIIPVYLLRQAHADQLQSTPKQRNIAIDIFSFWWLNQNSPSQCLLTKLTYGTKIM